MPTEPRGEASGAPSEAGRAEGGWTAAEWEEWYNQSGAYWDWSRKRHGDDSDDGYDDDHREIHWDQFESFQLQEDLLPPEILGWLLLRRARLPASARLNILAAVGNRLDFEGIERAMRDQEEELMAADGGKGGNDWNRGRRTYWVEEEGQWGLLADPEDDELLEGHVHWVGDRLPPEVYQQEGSCDGWTMYTSDGGMVDWQWWDDDFYTQDDSGTYWAWSEVKQMQDVDDCFWADPENNKQMSDSFTAVQQKVRTFKEARQFTKAKGLSRGSFQ